MSRVNARDVAFVTCLHCSLYREITKDTAKQTGQTLHYVGVHDI